MKMRKNSPIGGQAVLEGVMMRGPNHMAVAVRTAAGSIALEDRALGRPGDVWVGLSTSGNASNVCAAAEVARATGLITIALTGEHGGRLAPLCNIAIRAPANRSAVAKSDVVAPREPR